MGEADGSICVRVTVILGILCNKMSSLTWGFPGNQGERWLPPSWYHLEKGHPIRHSWMPHDRFRTPAMEHPGSWSRACTGPTVNIVRWCPCWFSITTLLYSDVDICVLGCKFIYLDFWVRWVCIRYMLCRVCFLRVSFRISGFMIIMIL